MIRPAGTANYRKPRGSWQIAHISALYGASNQHVLLITDMDVYVKVEVSEPIFLSPF